MSRGPGPSTLVVRHLLAHPAGAATVAILVLLLSAIAAAAPRAVQAMHTAGLQYELTAIGAEQRDIGASGIGVPETGPGSGVELSPAVAAVWGAFDDRVQAARAAMPEPLRSATLPAEYLLSVDSLPVEYPGSGNHAKLSFAFDPRSDRHARYVDGAPPAERTDGVVEIALAEANATALGMTVGDTRTLGDGTAITVRLSGIFSPVDPDDDYWQHTPLLTEPSIYDDGLSPPVYTGTGLVAPEQVPALSTLPVAARQDVWFPLSPDAVTAAEAPTLLAQLRRFESTPTTLEVMRPGDWASPLAFSAGAAETIETTLSRDAATDAVLAMTASGPLGVMLAVLILGGRIITARRVDAVRLLGARGASGLQLRGLMAVEGLVAGLPAAVIGTAIGMAATPGTPEPAQFLLPAVVGLLPAILLAVPAVRASGRTQRSDIDAPSGGRRRVVVELVVVGLSAVATIALIGRGLGTAASSGGVDPLLASVPLLLALAACVVALRLYPLPLAWLAGRARSRPTLTPFLGPVRALRDPSTGIAPVLALVVGVAVAVSSGVLLSTIRDGVVTAAETSVGADVRVRAALTAGETSAIGALPGVAASAAVSGATTVIIDAGGRRSNSSLVFVDTADLARVQEGIAGALPVAGLTGDDSDGIPVVASQSVAGSVGSSEEPTIDGRPMRVLAVVPGATALTERANWVIMDARYSPEFASGPPVAHELLLRLEPGADPDAVVAQLRTITGPDAVIDTPGDAAAAIDARPSSAGLQAALLIAIAVTGLLSAITIAMTLVIGAPGRARILALLGMLGGRRRQAGGLVAWEVSPPAVAAIVVGVVLGICLPFVVLAGVDLRGFTGGRLQPGYSIDAGLTLALLGGFVVVTALFTLIALGTSRRARASSILRTVEE